MALRASKKDKIYVLLSKAYENTNENKINLRDQRKYNFSKYKVYVGWRCQSSVKYDFFFFTKIALLE